MGKTSEVRELRDAREVRSPGAGVETQGQRSDEDDAQKAGRRRGDGGTDEGDGADAAEHLQQDFAKVRAKVAIDPVIASRSFAAAWTTDVIEEEDEAEFIDAVADCLGAGFSLESALTGWDNGTLAADGSEDGVLFDDESERDDEAPSAFPLRHTPTGGRRIFMS